MRATVRVLLVFAIAMSCTDRRAAVVEYATRHAGELVSSTRPVWIQYKALPDRDIPPSEVPATVRALEPAQVVATEHGIVVHVYTTYGSVTGLFIRHDPAFDPPGQTPRAPDSDDLRHERLAPDVYWFSRPR